MSFKTRTVWFAAVAFTVIWILLRVFSYAIRSEIWSAAEFGSGLVAALLLSAAFQRSCKHPFLWVVTAVGGIHFALYVWVEGRLSGPGLLLFLPIILPYSLARACLAYLAAKALFPTLTRAPE